MITVGLVYGGAGSAAVAARNLGMRVDFNLEPRGEHFLDTFKKNFGGYLYPLGSNKPKPYVCYTSVGIIPSESNYYVDIIVGQPDCKMFSNLRTRKKEEVDIKKTQLADFFTTIGSSKPKAFVVENLPKATDAIFPLLTSDPDFLYCAKGGNNMRDYNLYKITLNAEVFIPQSRVRSFIVGVLKPLIYTHRQPLPTDHFLGCKYLLNDLVHQDSYKIYKNHKPAKHSEERIKGFDRLKAGESYYGTQNNRRIDPDKNAPVITSHCTQQVHPTLPRTLTVRENARLMGWPDTFEFTGGTTKQLDQVGKAIVIPVIQYILNELKVVLKD